MAPKRTEKGNLGRVSNGLNAYLVLASKRWNFYLNLSLKIFVSIKNKTSAPTYRCRVVFLLSCLHEDRE
jgi:hypothetical protein